MSRRGLHAWFRSGHQRWIVPAVGLLRRCGRSVLNVAFPPQCVNCGAQLSVEPATVALLCPPCRAELRPAMGPHCRKCGSLSVPGDVDSCPWCRQWRLHFDGAIPWGKYEGSLRETVLRMKRPRGEQMAQALGSLLAEMRREELAACTADLVVPMPMHWVRRWQRGTNSPERIAEALAHGLGLRAANRVLLRCRNTKRQPHLSPRQRFVNVRGAFAVRPGIDLRGQRILLVDDVLTTGASCSAAAQALKRAGAALVVAAIVARAEGAEPQ